jgi:hypothetical protein
MLAWASMINFQFMGDVVLQFTAKIEPSFISLMKKHLASKKLQALIKQQ